MKAEEIVKGLTEAQKVVLRKHRAGVDYGAEIWPTIGTKAPYSFAATGRPLMDMGLLQWCTDPRKTATRITPLGLEVRSLLQSMKEVG